MKASNEINKKPLPAIKPACGLRIPPSSSNFIQANYKLKTDLVIQYYKFLSCLVT